MKVEIYAIISSANQAENYPDTCYFNGVDLDTGREFQGSTRKYNAGQLTAQAKVPLHIHANVIVLPRRMGGGYSLIFDEITIEKVGSNAKT